jgi:hypothetical protein
VLYDIFLLTIEDTHAHITELDCSMVAGIEIGVYQTVS